MLVGCLAWGVHEVGAAHAQAAEQASLRAHGSRVSGTVTELGGSRRDGSPSAAWITASGTRSCFVRTGPAVRTLRVGARLAAVVDDRDPTTTCTGMSVDLLARSATGAYASAVGAPAGTAVALTALVAARVGRRRAHRAGPHT